MSTPILIENYKGHDILLGLDHDIIRWPKGTQQYWGVKDGIETLSWTTLADIRGEIDSKDEG